MLRFMQRTSNLVRFLLLILACSSIVARISSRTVESADLIEGIQNPVIMTRSYPIMIKTIQEKMDNGEDRFCQIEYQITRKRPGKCTRISNGISGCISEDYIDPFHPDCF